MRGVSILMTAVYCIAALTSCGGSGGEPPAGVSITRKQNYDGSLSDMASEVTTDTLLSHKNAKLLSARPFPDCPGEAGLQTFRAGGSLLEVAFTQWAGTAVTARYERKAGTAADPRAEQALRRAVCSA